VLLPLYRSSRRWSNRNCEVELPLFSGYIFASFDPHERLPILQTPGVVQVVSNGAGPVPVEREEIDNLRRIVEMDILAEPWMFLKTGQIVEVTHGSLAGLRGAFVRRKNGLRLVISVSLLQRAVAIEVDAGAIKPVQSPCPPSKLALCTRLNEVSSFSPSAP
jgi:transcription antitermination factor NusG